MRRVAIANVALFTALLGGAGACSGGGEGTPDGGPPGDARADAAPVGQGSEPQGDLVVNEVFPEPPTGPDWIELANRGSATVDLSGYFISDASDRLDHYYEFPEGTTLAAGAYLIVWADNGDPGEGHHAPFQLGGADGVVVLGPTGLVVDNLVYLVDDGGALARTPDHEGLFFADPAPSPGAANGGAP